MSADESHLDPLNHQEPVGPIASHQVIDAPQVLSRAFCNTSVLAVSPISGRARSNALCYDWLIRGCKRTLSPFHRGIVTTYTLELGAAGEGDNRDHMFSAFRAAGYWIHEILPILPVLELFESNSCRIDPCS